MVRTKVFVGNLSFQTKEPELAAEFGNAGKVISANIITRGPRSLGYGFVEMDSEQDAENAVKVMNKKEINGRPINVEIAKPQDENKPARPPKKEGENNEESRPRRPRRRIVRKRGEGEAQEKGEVQKNDGKQEEHEKRPRRPRKGSRTTEPGQKRVFDEQNREESKTTLFVANLPFALDDEAFGKVVTGAGLKLKAAHVVKKRNGRSKGYGFIEFETEEEQKKALAALNKKEVDSRELSVKIALTEIKVEGEQLKEAKPVEKKTPPQERDTAPAEKKASPAEKKVAPAEKKAAPAEKKAAPAEKKAAPAEKKAAPAEKKAAPAEKKAAPAEKKAAPAEKKDSPQK